MVNSLSNTYPKIYSRRTVVVGANSRLEVSIYGSYFCILENDAQNILVSFNDQEEAIIDKAIGIQVADGVEVTKVVFRNDTGTDKTLTYAVADKRFEDFRNSIEGIVDVEVQASANVVPSESANAITTANTEIIAARTTRKKVSLYLKNTAAQSLEFLGTVSGGTVSKTINPGESLEDIETTGALYGKTATGTIAAADIILVEVY